MQMSSRFALAVHILSLLGIGSDSEPTSEWIAASTGVNPVMIRNITGQLRRAGLVRTRQGVAGVRLAHPLASITLLDVYRAVERERALFSIHARPNPACPVGASIQTTLEHLFGEAQQAMERQLALTTLAEVVESFQSS